MTEAFILFKKQAQALLKEDGVNYAAKGIEVVELMANRYLEALEKNDQKAMNKYISGLMLRFWNSIAGEKDQDEAISQLYRALDYAFKYRAWQDPSKNISAQQAIKQCIKTIKRQDNYDNNLDKHKTNFNHTSLDIPMNDTDSTSAQSTVGDLVMDEADLEYRERSTAELAAIEMVQRYINNKKLVEAIILDTIAFNEVEKVTKKVVDGQDPDGKPRKFTQTYKEFWPYKCVQILSKLPADFAKDFGQKYSFNPVELDKALTAIRSATNQKLYRYLSKTLEDAKGTFA